MSKHFTLSKVKVLDGLQLALIYADGEAFTVDLASIVKRHKTLALLRDASVFKKPKITDGGQTLTWAGNDDLQLAADNLRARAIEQAGGVSHEFIWHWMDKHQLTLDLAAKHLGLSRRMLAYYRSGEKPVPLTVGLACLGWEMVQAQAGAANDGLFAIAG
ncbi:MAG TPA: DUF2442 domain-containing protein [Burkholderiaceae bacterium]|nr:DUF2442 domain-containing protein [Burkholderiaceae bacterium]